MSLQFHFPQNRQDFQTVTNIDHFKQLVVKEDQHQGSPIVKYKFVIRRNKYLYIKCRKCASGLTYRARYNSGENDQEPLFVLVKFNNQHRHVIERKQLQTKLIQNFINQLPKNLDLKASKLYTLNAFPNISLSQFYYVYQKTRNPFLTYQQLIQKLDEAQYDIQSEPFEYNMKDLPNLMLIIHPKMKQKYLKYGHCVGFDTTYHTIKEKKDGVTFKLGAFMGLSAAKHLVPFGLVITSSQTKEAFYSIFKSFSHIMRKSPQFYITDQSIAMKSALQKLKDQGQFSGHHVLDSFHLLRNIKKRLTKKENLKYFAKLLKSQNQKEYEKDLMFAYENLQIEELEILKKIDIEKSIHSYSGLPSGLIGFGTSNSWNEKFHDLLKNRLAFEHPFTKTIKIALQLMDQLIDKCECWQLERIPVENYYFKQVKQIRFSVDKKVFMDFCQQLQKMVYIQCIQYQKNGDYCKLIDKKLQWDLKLYMIQGKWTCQCKYDQKSGTPCNHIIKACLLSSRRILNQFHPRWLLQKLLPKHSQQAKRGVGRKCKRNRR